MGCYWHLVGRGQGCYPISYSALDSAQRRMITILLTVSRCCGCRAIRGLLAGRLGEEVCTKTHCDVSMGNGTVTSLYIRRGLLGKWIGVLWPLNCQNGHGSEWMRRRFLKDHIIGIEGMKDVEGHIGGVGA